MWVIAPGNLWERKASLWPALPHTARQPGGTIHSLLQTHPHGKQHDKPLSQPFQLASHNTCTTIGFDLTWIYIGLTPVSAVAQWKVISLFEIGRARRTSTSRGWQAAGWKRNWWTIPLGSITKAYKHIFIKHKTTHYNRAFCCTHLSKPKEFFPQVCNGTIWSKSPQITKQKQWVGIGLRSCTAAEKPHKNSTRLSC